MAQFVLWGLLAVVVFVLLLAGMTHVLSREEACVGRWCWGSGSSLQDAATIVVPLVAGLGGVLAIVISYRKRRFEEREEERSELGVDRDERDRGVELLKEESTASQIAGVYTLFDVADKSERMRQSVVNILLGHLSTLQPGGTTGMLAPGSAAVRKRMLLGLQKRWKQGGADGVEGTDSAGTAPSESQGAPWNSLHYDFSGCYLPSGFTLEGGYFSGEFRFVGAVFEGDHACESVRFLGSVSYEGATFGKTLSISECVFEDVLDLRGIDVAESAFLDGNKFRRDDQPLVDPAPPGDDRVGDDWKSAEVRQEEASASTQEASSDAGSGPRVEAAEALLSHSEAPRPSGSESDMTIADVVDLLNIPYAAANKLRFLGVLQNTSEDGKRPRLTRDRVRSLEAMRTAPPSPG